MLCNVDIGTFKENYNNTKLGTNYTATMVRNTLQILGTVKVLGHQNSNILPCIPSHVTQLNDGKDT